MITAEQFVDQLQAVGLGHATGVPCSYFNGPIVEMTRRGRYVPAVNEGAALALAAGSVVAGRRTVVMLQNSGYGNLVNPLTSLLMPYRIPVLVFMSLRGWPDPAGDEPQHAVMGSTVHDQLKALGVEYWTLSPDAVSLDDVLLPAMEELARGGPAFILVPKGTVGGADPAHCPLAPRETSRLTRRQAVTGTAEALPDAFYVSTTGYASRELFAAHDTPRNFYMQGSMGHALVFALGITRAVTDRPVVVLDGDGALLMHLGSMATAGAVQAANLVHVVLDNGVYESTGGQDAGSDAVSFCDIARATGYRTAQSCSSPEDLAQALKSVRDAPGPHFLVARTAAVADSVPPRATSALTAERIHARFSGEIEGGSR
ncbi:phosphonopyruvate decarboxylase [Streptomyces roseifaciens]|uniref:phosphonopyruvate decarboxylase n=1 Tax=Streptomyces roseifaciens TaxID=1488406 RepID=UPI0007181905|nr:phosphonopyruvate decarboxylase [Streptomyces roseifaciens]